MKNILFDLKKNKKVASVFTDTNNTDRFSTGFIGNVSDEFIIIKHITPFGKYDGFLLKKIDNIYRIESGGKYENKIQFLYQIQNQNHNEIIENSDFLIKDLLFFAKHNKVVVSIELCDSEQDDIQGYVEEIGDEKIKIKTLDDYGENDGLNIINTHDITHLKCDSDNEIALKILSQKCAK